MHVAVADLGQADVRALLEMHQRDMHDASPPGTSFALDLSGLNDPSITIFAAREDDDLLAVGALRQLSADQAEIKSMRTRPDRTRRGAAAALLGAMIETARSRGTKRLSLETGTSAHFAPAIALYRASGFVPGPDFGDYRNGPHNRCYHLNL